MSTRLALAIVLAAALAACAPPRETARCGRLDVASMGPENGYRTTVDTSPSLDDAAARIEVAFTSAPPPAGPVTLVQSVDGREIARWELKAAPAAGIVHRCSIGFTASPLSCGATIPKQPHPIGGQWQLLPGDNPILEASVAFHLCQ